MLGDSLVQFEGTSLKVEHGGVSVSTSKGMATTAGAVRVAPVSNASWTEFNVSDTDGTVRIAARKGDLSVTDADGKATLLAQGQDKTLDEQSDQTDQSSNRSKKKNKKREVAGAAPAAGGGWLDSPIAVGIGGAAILG